MATVLLVDDHLLFSEGIRLLMDAHPEYQMVECASNGSEAMQALGIHHIDIVLLDLELPDISGFDLCKQIIALDPDMKIIALTTHNRPAYVRKILQSGALGYLIKNADAEEMFKALDCAMKREVYINPQVSKLMFEQLSGISKQRPHGLAPTLTRREKEVLKLIADEMTTREIAEALFISESTVETHRANLFSKLDVKNSVGLLKKAIELDLLKL